MLSYVEHEKSFVTSGSVFVDSFSQPPPLLTSQIYSNSSQYTRQAPAIIERADSDTPGTEPVAKVGHMLQTTVDPKSASHDCRRRQTLRHPSQFSKEIRNDIS